MRFFNLGSLLIVGVRKLSPTHLKLAERGGRNGKKRAIIATARKLAVLLHRLWVKRRSVRAVAQQQPDDNAGSSVIKNIEEKRKAKLKRRVPVIALIAWPAAVLEMEDKVDKQVATPA